MASTNKDKGKFLSMLLIVAIISGIVILSGCIENPPSSGQEKINITDMSGRVVEVPTNVDSIVCFGPGTLRLITYLNARDRVVGVEDAEKKWPAEGRPYRLAHPELGNLPVVGQGGPTPVPNPEAIINVKPDIIFISYIEPREADDLQKKTGIPVVVLSYGQFATFDSEHVFKSLKIAGKILNKEDRANEVIQFIKNINKDLNDRTKDVPDEEKKSAYVGGVGYKGMQGITSTDIAFPPFKAVNAKNVAEELKNKSKGHVFVDREKILEWNPDILFIDGGGYQIVVNEYHKDPKLFNSLKAVQNGQVYGTLPFNYYTTNIDTALADAYYVGKVLYPERFKDVNPEAKADEIYIFLVGKPLYKEMKKDSGGFGKIDLKLNKTEISQPIAVLCYR